MQAGNITSKRMHYKAARTCHDAFILNELGCNELCKGCSNYRDEIPKKKPQNLMGLRFQCIYITPNGIPLLNEASVNETSANSIRRKSDIVVVNESEVYDDTPTRKRKKQSIKKPDAEKLSLERKAKNMELQLTYYEKKNIQLEDTLCQNKSEVESLKKEMELKNEAHLSELDSLRKEMEQEKRQSLEENNTLREIVQSQNLEVLLLKEKVKTSQNKIYKQNQQLTSRGKPIKLIHNLFQQLMKRNFTWEDVVHDVISLL